MLKKKRKVLQIPQWMMENGFEQKNENQRNETECHTRKTFRVLAHDVVEEGDDSSSHDEDKVGPSEDNGDLYTARARASGSNGKLDIGRVASRKALTKKRTGKKKKGNPGVFSAAELDKKTRWTESPAKPFQASGAERESKLKLLGRRTKETKAFKAELGEAFLLAYTRYRAKVTPGYQAYPSEVAIAETAASIVFFRGLTPGQVLAYWHEHIGDFTDLKAVPLRFLASPANIDQVALAHDGKSGTAESRAKDKGGRIRVHAYGDARALDSRLRGCLEESGFDVSQFSDRELMSIQNAARVKAAGKRMFVSSKLAPLVKCAAEELYGDAA